MKTNVNRLLNRRYLRDCQLGLWGLFLGIGILFTGCDAAIADSGTRQPAEAVEALNAHELIQTMEMSPLPVADNEETEQYVLRVQLSEIEGVRYPLAFNMLGATSHSPSSMVHDDGTGYDAIAGDLIYSGVVTQSCDELQIPEGMSGKDIISITVSCEGDFITPGEECEGEGVCPETAERSFLWGLIEYETDVVVCWCGFSCDYEVSLDLGF